MSLPKFNLSQMDDTLVRDNFQRLLDFLRVESPFLGFKHFELTFTAAVTNFKFLHGLGFRVKDVFQTSVTGSGTVTFNYGNFTDTQIDLTTTNSCVVRFFAGAYNSGGTT